MEDSIPYFKRGIPINQLKGIKKSFSIRLKSKLPDWLGYKGSGKFPVEPLVGHYLSLEKDGVIIQNLMDWIRDSNPIYLSESVIPKKGYTKIEEFLEEEIDYVQKLEEKSGVIIIITSWCTTAVFSTSAFFTGKFEKKEKIGKRNENLGCIV